METILIILGLVTVIYGALIMWTVRSNKKLLKPYKQKTAKYPKIVNLLLSHEETAEV